MVLLEPQALILNGLFMQVTRMIISALTHQRLAKQYLLKEHLRLLMSLNLSLWALMLLMEGGTLLVTPSLVILILITSLQTTQVT